MEIKNLKQADIIRITGYTGPAISKITKGTSEPKFGFLKSILIKFPDISARWLLTGEGNMLIGESEVSDHSEFDRIYRALTHIVVELGELREDVNKINIKDG